MPRTRSTVMVVPCGADKLAHPAPARDLYTSSSFRLALAAAEAEAEAANGRVLVLSALHGLVELDTVVAPYDVKMGDPGSVTADLVCAQAVALGIEWGADVYAFLPARYFAVLDEALRTLDVYAADVYEATSGIGDHRHVCAVVRDTDIPEGAAAPGDRITFVATGATGTVEAVTAKLSPYDGDRRTMDDLLPRCWWTRGLRFEDLRESEYAWSSRAIGDAYGEAFLAVVDEHEGVTDV